jgi:hypothetical protein
MKTIETTQIVTWINNIKKWHYDRNLIEGANDKDQICKLIQEVGELSDNVCKQRDVRDDIGDIIVVLVNIAERNGVSITDCLEVAYNDIKDRKGKMVDGIFIKESDEVAAVSAHPYYLQDWNNSTSDSVSITVNGVDSLSVSLDSMDYQQEIDYSQYLTSVGTDLDSTITVNVSDIDVEDNEDYFVLDKNRG